jgi:hypothetical protein
MDGQDPGPKSPADTERLSAKITEPAGSPRQALVSQRQRDVVFTLAAVLLVAVAFFVVLAYQQESSFYEAILDNARKNNDLCPENTLLFEVALAPFRSLSIVRMAALFLSFVLVALGALFVLTGIEAAYKMTVEHESDKATLETASPGLVLVTAGALLLGVSLYRSGSPEFRPQACPGGRTAPTASAGKTPQEDINSLNPPGKEADR